MNFTDYLADLTATTLNLNASLAYGYGNSATTEINSLKALIAKAEEMIPVLEAEACFNEAEELDREDRSFNNWMVMLYGNDSVSPVEARRSSKANRLKRRKQNKKHHRDDRYHGKCFEGRDEEGRRIIKDNYDRFPVSDKVHNHSALKAKAREEDYFLNPCASVLRKEKEEAEKARREQEKANEMFTFWTTLNGLPDTRFVVLCNYDNGQSWEDNVHCEDLFLDIMTKEQVVEYMKRQCVIKAEYDQLPVVCERTTKGVVNGNKKGICFHFEDRDYPDWEEFVLLPI